jgi:hypothetical protein
MDRHHSFGNAPAGSLSRRGRTPQPRDVELERRMESAINFPGNPRFWPRVAFRMVPTTRDMEDRKEMLMNHALVVKEEGPLGLRSVEELKGVIFTILAFVSTRSAHTIVFPILLSSSSRIGMLEMWSLQLAGLWKVQSSSDLILGT